MQLIKSFYVGLPGQSIFGGSGNSDGGLSYAAVFGCNVTAVMGCAFYVECLNAVNTSNYLVSGSYSYGTIFYVPVGSTPPPGALALYIQH